MSREETPVSDVMTSPVRTISEDTTVTEAATILADEHIGSLVVGESIICGIITETDIVRTVGADVDPDEMMVTEIMSEPVVTIRPHEAAHIAGERMGHNNVKKLPVTKNGEPVGIITTTDLAHFFPKSRILMATDPEKDVHEGEFE
jgi:Predicted signal-transduction protein containing cAMP-binding and CBS domains